MQINTRLPTELVEKLDGYVAELNAQTPGAAFTRTDAVRIILTKALEEAPPAKSRRR